jgi:hypothetical protein
VRVKDNHLSARKGFFGDRPPETFRAQKLIPLRGLRVSRLSFFLRTSAHPLFALILSLVFLGIALNYVPLLLYVLHFARHKNAEFEVAIELAHKERYTRKYQLQSLLLFIPCVVPILTIVQEWQKRSSS